MELENFYILVYLKFDDFLNKMITSPYNLKLLFNQLQLDCLSYQEYELLYQNSYSLEYDKYETIQKQGQKITQASLVYEGYTKICLLNGHDTHTRALVPSMNFFNINWAITNKYHQFTLISITDCKVIHFNVASIQEIIMGNGDFALRIMQLNNKFDRTFFWQSNFSRLKKNMQGKFAAALLFHLEKIFMAPSFNILLKRGELAEMIGISRENVIKVIGELKKDGIIDVDGKNFKILDRGKLQFISENG